MMGNVTWEMLGFLGGLLSLVIGLWARLERRLRGTEREANAKIGEVEREAHAKIEGVEKSLADYKLEVAKNYASNAHLKDLEARLLDSIRQLKEDIRELPKNIVDLMGAAGRPK
jgi:hypothetical protein